MDPLTPRESEFLQRFVKVLQETQRPRGARTRLARLKGITAKQLIVALFTTPRRPKDDELRNAIETIAGTSRDATRLGKAFARHKGRVFGGKKAVIAGSHAGTMRWAVVDVAGGVAPTQPTQRQNEKAR